jgi:hypothetical protein
MNAKTNGGPAFPAQPIYQHPHGSTGMSSQDGMSLRDWFAGQALGLIAGRSWDHIDHTVLLQTWAQTAYGIADAMLAERSK